MRGTLARTVLVVLLLAPGGRGRDGRPLRRRDPAHAGRQPHIKARDFGSLGFGYAYACAEDQACRFADIIATVNAQRSRYFGPDGSFGDLGGQTNNLVSDFFYQRIKDSRVVERLRQRRYPHGPGEDVRATLHGFAAGWNAFLRRHRTRHPARPALPRRGLGHVPGKLNAIGAALQGVPAVNLGFNRHIAWTHTVSTARRFAVYELKLAPGDPTSYLVDGETVPMRARTVRVGGYSHTFYETRWGPRSANGAGVYQPYTGSSFVMAAELTDKGPRGHAILRNSQSENPSSPRYADQTRLYAPRSAGCRCASPKGRSGTTRITRACG